MIIMQRLRESDLMIFSSIRTTDTNPSTAGCGRGLLKPVDQPSRLGIDLAVQPTRRGDRKAQRQGAAPGRGERDEGAVSQYRRAEWVRHYEATFFRDEEGRKLVRHSEVEPIREFPIEGPFAIRAEIGHRAFDLDYHQLAGLAERQDVGAAPVGEREFEEARIAELLERAADAPRQQNSRDGC